LKCTS